jgi:Recombinase
VVADAGPHPNPRKAAEGYRLRVLAIEDASAEVVRRIFAEYPDGKGDRAIANGLNRDGIPCPSARRQGSVVGGLTINWPRATLMLRRAIAQRGHVSDARALIKPKRAANSAP